MSNYYLQRISYNKKSYPLLKDGNYLSIGFSDIYADKLYDINNYEDLRKHMENIWGKCSWQRVYQLLNFINFKKEDLIVVPLWYGQFSVYKIIGDKFVGNQDEELLETLKKLNLNISEDDDLGFFWKVEPVAVNIGRSEYADAFLTSRMHYRGTNIECNDIKTSIDNAVKGFKENKPINLFSEIIDNCRGSILELIKTKLKPEKFEKLIELYFKQCGANYAYKPSKADNKEGDCDIEASFELIKTIIHVQAKFHEGNTNEWAIEQIEDFMENMPSDDYSHIGWVVSTCDDFSEEAKKKASEKNILLINGKSFAEMLLKAGINSIDSNL